MIRLNRDVFGCMMEMPSSSSEEVRGMERTEIVLLLVSCHIVESALPRTDLDEALYHLHPFDKVCGSC